MAARPAKPKPQGKRPPMPAETRAKISASRRGKPVELRTTKTDWPSVRARYINGFDPGGDAPRQWPSLADVAAHFGISVRQVEDHSSSEGWPEQREAFRRDLAQREDALLLERLAAQNVRARTAFFGTALRAQQAINRKLQNDDPSASDLQRLMGALRSSQQVAEVAQGKPADGEGSGGPAVLAQFWAIFNRDPVPEVRDAFRAIDASATPSLGVVGGPGRS